MIARSAAYTYVHQVWAKAFVGVSRNPNFHFLGLYFFCFYASIPFLADDVSDISPMLEPKRSTFAVCFSYCVSFCVLLQSRNTLLTERVWTMTCNVMQQKKNQSQSIGTAFIAAFSGGPDPRRSRANGFWSLPSTTIVLLVWTRFPREKKRPCLSRSRRDVTCKERSTKIRTGFTVANRVEQLV